MKKVLHLKSKFITNASNVSKQDMFGAEHIIVEGVGSMICDTVMNSILYTEKAVTELAKKVAGKTVHAPASHPSNDEGEFILAGSPEAVAQNYVGAFAFNYRMKGDRLIHDLAINEEIASRTEQGREILERIKTSQPIDTSTGLLINDYDEEQGYGSCGMMYDLVANDIDLDHDAILLHEQGAATNRQGVGVFANKDQKISVDEFCVNASIANTKLQVADIEFDEAGALERIKEFTNSQEAPSSNLRRFFFYFDPTNTESFDGYMFPFADIVDGRPVAVKDAVFKAKSMIESSDLSDDEKQESLASVENYILRMKKTGLAGNAWNAIRKFLFGEFSANKELEEKIFMAINKGNEDKFIYPTEIKEDYFISKDNDGKLYKQTYSFSEDKVVINSKSEVKANISYESNEETDAMKEMILKALADAGIDASGMSDEEVLAKYAELVSKPAESNADEEDKPSEDKPKEDEPEANGMEGGLEEKIAAIVEAKVAELMAGGKPEVNEEDEMAKQVANLNLGISVNAAKAMGVEAMKTVLATNGVIAANAATDYSSKFDVSDDYDMPE